MALQHFIQLIVQMYFEYVRPEILVCKTGIKTLTCYSNNTMRSTPHNTKLNNLTLSIVCIPILIILWYNIRNKLDKFKTNLKVTVLYFKYIFFLYNKLCLR